MAAALDAGAAIVNDISGLTHDPAPPRWSPRAAARSSSCTCAARPATMMGLARLRRRRRRGDRRTGDHGSRRPEAPASRARRSPSTPASASPSIRRIRSLCCAACPAWPHWDCRSWPACRARASSAPPAARNSRPAASPARSPPVCSRSARAPRSCACTTCKETVQAVGVWHALAAMMDDETVGLLLSYLHWHRTLRMETA